MALMPDVELVFAQADDQFVVQLSVAEGTTVASVVERSGIVAAYPEFDFTTLRKGVYGRLVADDHRVGDGDRVEIYRPLTVDPREARRKRAGLKQAENNKKRR